MQILNNEDLERINLVGLELEGFFQLRPTFKGEFKHDSSVEISGCQSSDEDFECNGECRENCSCYEDCNCDNCCYCSLCSSYTTNCTCYECRYCSLCDNSVENCDCNILKDSDCDKNDCKDNDVCENCYTCFRENQEIYTNCNNADHVEFSCDRDCSCECECECDCVGNNGDNVGEFVSRPLEKSEVEEWIFKNYPTTTNRTCGGHIHISLKSDADYMSLMDRRFYDYYMKRMLAWAEKMKIAKDSHFYERYRGKQFCYANFQPEQQRDMRDHYDDPRYAHINYAYNVDHRHTVEFRLLPCFQKDYLMVSGVKETIEIVEDYLKSLPKLKSMRLKFEV